jgi:hypothetical protein
MTSPPSIPPSIPPTQEFLFMGRPFTLTDQEHTWALIEWMVCPRKYTDDFEDQEDPVDLWEPAPEKVKEDNLSIKQTLKKTRIC